MASIGTLALKLTADPTGLQVALSNATQNLSSWATGGINKVQEFTSNFVSNMKMLAANPFGAMALALSKVIDSFEKIKSFGSDLFSGAVAGLNSLIDSGIRAGNEQQGLQRRFGLSAEAAGGLSLQGRMLGVDMDELTNAMRMFSVRLGEASHNGGPAAQALQEIGLNARELGNMQIDQALGRIGDALNRVSSAGERNRLRWEILGRRAAGLEPILNQATAGIQRAQEQSSRWGLTLTANEATMLRTARISRTTSGAAMGSVWQSFANATAVGFAPLITFFNEMKVAIIDLAQGPLGWLRDGIRNVGTISAAIVDGIKTGWRMVAPVWQEVSAAVSEAWNNLRSAFGGSEDFASSMRMTAAVITSSLAPVIRSIGNQLAHFLNLAANNLRRFTAQIQGNIESLRRLVDFLQNALEIAEAVVPRRFGGEAITRAADQLRELRRGAQGFLASVSTGLTGMFQQPNAELEEFNARLNQQANDIKARRYNEARSFAESAVSPMQRLNEQLQTAQHYYNDGLISYEEMLTISGRVSDQILALDRNRNTGQLARGVSGGSAEAITMLNQFRMQSEQTADPQRRIAAIVEQQLEIQRQTMQNGAQLLTEVRNNSLQLVPAEF